MTLFDSLLLAPDTIMKKLNEKGYREDPKVETKKMDEYNPWEVRGQRLSPRQVMRVIENRKSIGLPPLTKEEVAPAVNWSASRYESLNGSDFITKIQISDTEVLERPKLAQPAPIKNRPQQNAPDEYLSMLSSLGMRPELILQKEIADFLWENDIEMYDLDEVGRYLDSLITSPYFHVEWQPLRPADTRDGGQPYAKNVPIETLRKVKLIVDKFGPDVRFLVSEIVNNPDPFIMVTPADGWGFRIVFDFWDEPGFSKIISRE